MRERIKGKTLVARDEGDDADGVVIKLYGEEWVRALLQGLRRAVAPRADRA
jgi:hypothetical protein